MTASLLGGQRSVLEGLVQGVREWFEEDLGDGLEGPFGIHGDGLVEDVSSLSLSAAGLAVRADLVEVIGFLRSEGESAAGSVERLVREAAFTHLNRLVAVRVAEAVGLLPEMMGRGLESGGFRGFSELAPTVGVTEWGRFGVFVGLCADELASDVPALFDPRNPLLGLELSEPVLARAVEAIAGVDDEIWAAPDALGWAYQFFNTGEERREMRESSAPRNSRELAVRNQFFTPSYVVEFLVQNGLGAHLAAGFPELVDELPLLVEVPTERIEVDLDAVSVLDPACGSGHFLLGAYDVLEKTYQHAGVNPADAAPRIVASLWGIDIDPRATQIAQAAVIFRARRHCRDRELPVPNVICARALPAGPDIDELIEELPDDVARVVRAISEELVDAPLLGPLLKVEERLSTEIGDMFGTGVIEGTLSEAAPAQHADQLQTQVLEALGDIADSATSTPAQRLFAAEAQDAVRFINAMTRRYTAIVMNPPFGEPIPQTKQYLKSAYQTSTREIAAAFIDRASALVEDQGSWGALVTRLILFLDSHEGLRRDVLQHRTPLQSVADLGVGVLEQALVEVAALCATKTKNDSASSVSVLSALDVRDKVVAVSDWTNPYEVLIEDWKVYPKAALVYWLPPKYMTEFRRRKWNDYGLYPKTGGQSDDDFRLLRLHWELAAGLVAGGRWVPISKGGEYEPYWSDVHLAIDWKNWEKRPTDRPDFLQGGLFYSYRTTSDVALRLLPRGSGYLRGGPAVHGDIEALWLALGSCYTRIFKVGVEAILGGGDSSVGGSAARNYSAPWLGSIPLALTSIPPARRDELVEAAIETSMAFVRHAANTSETSPLFVGMTGLDMDLDQLAKSERARLLEMEELALSTTALFEDALHEVGGPSPVLLDNWWGKLPNEDIGERELDSELLTKTDEELVETAATMHKPGRHIVKKSFFGVRRLELMMRISGKSVLELGRSLADMAPSERELSETAERILSYLVGCSLGRWTGDLASFSWSGLGAELPRYPPARSIESTLRPAVPGSGMLVDQVGSSSDIVQVIQELAAKLPARDLLEEAVSAASTRNDIRSYLRHDFFQLHLRRYSMSRRHAPVFWHLGVPSGTWGIWVHAPQLERESLYALVSLAEDRLRIAERQILHLQREAESREGGRKASEVAKELDAEQTLAVELGMFRVEAERIANLGWEPDLDDGIVLNAAPLADLFPAWMEAAEYRDQLRAGKYDWATVAQYAQQL